MSENTNTTESLKTNWIKRNRVILTVGGSVLVTAIVTTIIVKTRSAAATDVASDAIQHASEAIDAVIDTAV